MSADPEFASIVMRLSAYLAMHPQASDTVEGISAWWLAPLRPSSPAAVESALRWMIDRGAVAAISAADGRVHYRCRRDIDDLEIRLHALSLDPHSLPPFQTGRKLTG